MKKTLAVLVAAFVPLVGLAAPASADTVALPFGGTATLTIPDVTLTPGGNCINHYGSLTVAGHAYDWNVDITANGPSTWPASDYLYGTGPQTRIVDLQLCPLFDKAGTYTASGLFEVYDDDYNASEVVLSDQFVISNPAPPPPPPPAPVPPPPPAPVYSEVTGTVTKKPIASGVKLRFRSNAIPAGTLWREALKWKVTYDGRTKRIAQGPNESDALTLKFKEKGRHVIKVFRNGSKVLKTTVQVR